MATFGGSSDTNPTKMVTFKTSDDEQVKVPVEIARMFGVVRGFYDGDRDRPEVENADPFPLPNVRSDIFDNIVLASKMLPNTKFFGQPSDKTIVELVKAADYLHIQELLDLVMPSVRKRFSLGDNEGVKFVYMAEAEAILRWRAASARKPTMATYGGSSDTNPTKMVTFKTSDDKQVKVPVEIARMFGVVRDFYDGDLDRPEVENADPFPLPNVSSYVLDIVVYACKKPLEFLAKYDAVEIERQKFDVEFFGKKRDKTIVEQVRAADYLEIEELLDLVMPSFRKRFRLGYDKDVEFVYTAEAEAEAEAILLSDPECDSEGASS